VICFLSFSNHYVVLHVEPLEACSEEHWYTYRF